MVRTPAGADWIDVWTGNRVAGGVIVELDAALDGPPPLLARAGSAMLVDLATGGWRPEPYKRGIWLFPPGKGPFAWSAVEDGGDGDGPIDEIDTMERTRAELEVKRTALAKRGAV